MIDVTVPKSGMDSDNIGVGRILVAVGERVVPGQPLVELETAKATIELAAEIPGVVVEIVLGQGEDAEVGDVILRLDEAS